MVTLEDVKAAAERLAPILRPTPLEHVHSVSAAVGRDVWVKEEQLQRTGSYKIRGAYNLISQLPGDERVVAASAGNHAQGVALAARLTGHHADVYMPRRASLAKIEATENYGANVILVDGGLEDCVAAARQQADQDGSIFVPPFDHPLIIAGQGTLGLELARDLPEEIQSVVIPVGGGGLISGAALALKHLRPDITVFGVEAVGAPTMAQSLRAGHPVRLDQAFTMADGIAMREVSQLTFDHVKTYVDGLVVVTEEEMSHALVILLERAKAVVELAGAASLAAVLAGEVPGDGAVCAVLSGGNVDPAMLMRLIDHGLTAAGRYLVIRVIMGDRPGELAHLTKLLALMLLNVVEINHHRAGYHVEADQVEVEVTVEMRNRSQHDKVIETLSREGWTVEIMS